MKKKPTVVEVLAYMGACASALQWVRLTLRGDPSNLRKAWLKCENVDWISWLCMSLGVAYFSATDAAYDARNDAYNSGKSYADAGKAGCKVFRQRRSYALVKKAWDREVADYKDSQG